MKPDHTSAPVSEAPSPPAAGPPRPRSRLSEALVPADYAARVMALRAKHRWSQYEMADRLGVSRTSIPRWERGESAPRPVVWDRIEALEQGHPAPGMVPVAAGRSAREARLLHLVRELAEALRDFVLVAGDAGHPVTKRKLRLLRRAELLLDHPDED